MRGCSALSRWRSRGGRTNAGSTTPCAAADEVSPQRDRLLGLFRPRRLCEIRLDRRAEQRLERRLVDRVALEQVDRAPRVAVETRIEQLLRIGERRALGKGQIGRASCRERVCQYV